jgi:hypothetical protein
MVRTPQPRLLTHKRNPRRPRHTGCRGRRPTVASDCIVCSALNSDHLHILIDNTCRSSSQNLLDRPDITLMDWASFQACLDDRLLGNTAGNDEEAVDKCVEELTSAIQEGTEVSAPKRRPRADPRPLLPGSTQDEISLKNRLRRQWQVTRDPALKA